MITLPLLQLYFIFLKKVLQILTGIFLLNVPKPVGEIGGGIANALLGSIIIVFTASVIAIPIGIMCGIYLSENQTGKLSYWSRLAVDVLQGVPSIVIGIVIYFWVVKPIGTFSAFSGSVALAIMMLPIIIRSTEETLKLIPFSLKEAGLALGIALSSGYFKSNCALRHQRYSIWCHAFCCKNCRRNGTIIIYRIR